MRSNVSALLLTVVGASSVLAGSFTLNLERRDRARSKDTSNVRGDGAVGAIFNGTDWVTAATVGGQQVIMQIDTGSADLYVIPHPHPPFSPPVPSLLSDLNVAGL